MSKSTETTSKFLVTPIFTPLRGRPKLKQDDIVPQEKLIDKIKSAVSKGLSEPTIYASTTKGGMKLIFNGHHFIYSFRKGQYSIFQCCYKENKEQCKVRVVSNQKRVFHLDGEHVHFIQARDKSVTSLLFETGESQEDNFNQIGTPEINESQDKISFDNEKNQKLSNISGNKVDEKTFGEDLDSSYDLDSQQDFDANNFREKIKKRLQKALLGKKK